jgi:hypothetical protein
MAKISPTQLTLRKLREDGYLAEVVERWVPMARIRKDLWGWCDVVGVKRGETLAVQATSASNVSARVKKIADSETVGKVREAGWRIVVFGWKKVKNRWEVVERDVS